MGGEHVIGRGEGRRKGERNRQEYREGAGRRKR